MIFSSKFIASVSVIGIFAAMLIGLAVFVFDAGENQQSVPGVDERYIRSDQVSSYETLDEIDEKTSSEDSSFAALREQDESESRYGAHQSITNTEAVLTEQDFYDYDLMIEDLSKSPSDQAMRNELSKKLLEDSALREKLLLQHRQDKKLQTLDVEVDQ